MTSNSIASDSSTVSDSSNSRQSQGEQMVGGLALRRKINQLKKQIRTERVVSINEKIMKNKERVESDVSHHLSLSKSRTQNLSTCKSGSQNVLSLRMNNPIRLIFGLDQTSPDQDYNNDEEEVAFHLTANLPDIEKIPPFTTWIFSTRNQRMTDDQSIMETVPGDEKHEFSKAEKCIIRMVSQDYEPTEKVVQFLTRFVGGSTSEIHEVFKMLKKNDEEAINENVNVPPEAEHDISMFLDKSLASNLDTFDTLFCRRCLVFDCGLHGYGQTVITPAEQLKYPVESEEDDEPCSDQCYKRRFMDSINAEPVDIISWKLLEKDLSLKGLEMFGRNSCLITRNLLSGLKTCMEVYTYMHNGGPAVSSSEDQEIVPRLQSVGRKGKGKKPKHYWKSGGNTSTWRRIADGNQSNKQYTPCECNSKCGKDCLCLKNSTCCEKYCGCSKSCKNRFRGCHCAKSQCRSQQCPCFAAGRECDPDICRNCWVSCGGGSLGEPPRRGEGQCGNMRLLLRQQQRILLGKSDVTGWGSFVKNTVEEDDYLGEYTGELISQEEADFRGKLYDHANSSFLFNLNDEYVLDALRQGNKLKFANHSPNPNCYAKIIKVGGDHRVGIFAKHRIEAGQEIFYDYCYGPEQSPSWARKPGDPNEGPSVPPQARSEEPQPDDPKEGPSVPPQARSKKPQSHR